MELDNNIDDSWNESDYNYFILVNTDKDFIIGNSGTGDDKILYFTNNIHKILIKYCKEYLQIDNKNTNGYLFRSYVDQYYNIHCMNIDNDEMCILTKNIIYKLLQKYKEKDPSFTLTLESMECHNKYIKDMNDEREKNKTDIQNIKQLYGEKLSKYDEDSIEYKILEKYNIDFLSFGDKNKQKYITKTLNFLNTF